MKNKHIAPRKKRLIKGAAVTLGAALVFGGGMLAGAQALSPNFAHFSDNGAKIATISKKVDALAKAEAAARAAKKAAEDKLGKPTDTLTKAGATPTQAELDAGTVYAVANYYKAAAAPNPNAPTAAQLTAANTAKAASDDAAAAWYNVSNRAKMVSDKDGQALDATIAQVNGALQAAGTTDANGAASAGVTSQNSTALVGQLNSKVDNVNALP